MDDGSDVYEENHDQVFYLYYKRLLSTFESKINVINPGVKVKIMFELTHKLKLFAREEFYDDGYYDAYVSMSGQTLQNLSNVDYINLGFIMKKFFKLDFITNDFWKSYFSEIETRKM